MTLSAPQAEDRALDEFLAECAEICLDEMTLREMKNAEADADADSG